MVVWLALLGGGAALAQGEPAPPQTPPPSTFNVFYPEERALTDCQNNSIPLPNCGSKARGGWRQTLVFGLMVGGLGFIGWQIVRSSKRAKNRRDHPDELTQH